MGGAETLSSITERDALGKNTFTRGANENR